MKTPPPHGLICAAGVFVLGRHCPYSGESCRCTEARRAECLRRSKCHLPGTLLALSMQKVRPLHCLSAGQHSPIQAVALCRESPPAPGSPPDSMSAPEEMPSSRYTPAPGYGKPVCRIAFLPGSTVPYKLWPCAGKVLLRPEIRRTVCQHRSKCHLPGTLLALRGRNSSPASALPNKNAAFVRGKPGRGRRAVFIRLRRNSPLHCWSGTLLRPDSPAR